MAEAFLTTAKATVAGQLQGSLGAVPAVPGKLVFTFFNAALGARGHAAGVDQVSLQGHRGQRSGSPIPPGQRQSEHFTHAVSFNSTNSRVKQESLSRLGTGGSER